MRMQKGKKCGTGAAVAVGADGDAGGGRVGGEGGDEPGAEEEGEEHEGRGEAGEGAGGQPRRVTNGPEW